MDESARHRAMRSLDGLSVGDALGKAWAFTPDATERLSTRSLPPPPWNYTDDTVMATGVVATLFRFGEIDRDALALDLTTRFEREPNRGYGAGAFWLLSQLSRRRPWREVSVELFGGGSHGNGSAMRVAPVGAFFADDLDRVIEQAVASSEVTHHHADGKAGAVAVAVAAALAWQGRERASWEPTAFLARITALTPSGPIRDRVAEVASHLDADPVAAAAALGDGREVRCFDTVPFALWCAARHPHSYVDAIFAALQGTQASEADRDTMLAIVGGIVSLSAPPEALPAEWLGSREPLPSLPEPGRGDVTPA